MWIARVLLASLGLLACATTASADPGVVDAANEWVPVWRSSELVKEGTDLLDPAQRFDLAAQRMVCVVDTGTRVIGTVPGDGPKPFGFGEGFSMAPVRVVVIEGEANGCSGYVWGLYFRFQPRTRGFVSPCWTTKSEIIAVKAAVDAGNLSEAQALSQQVTARMDECRLSPCSMTKEEGAAIRAADAARNSKLSRELLERYHERSAKCWAERKGQ